MSPFWITMIVIIVVLVAACIVLYFLGKKAEKKQAEQKEQMDAVAQTVSMLIIDKKKLKLKEAGLPPPWLWKILRSTSDGQRCLLSKQKSDRKS